LCDETGALSLLALIVVAGIVVAEVCQMALSSKTT